MRFIVQLCGLFALLCVFLSAAAQAEVLPEIVTLTAADGLVMVGDFYQLPDDQPHPAVILLHGSGIFRAEWNHFVQPLLEAGFHVLNVDQRGHGETGGRRDLAMMIDDTQLWITWLSTHPGVQPNGIAALGSSMGTVPALGACAAVSACYTAIMASPGDFPLLTDEVYAQMEERSVLFLVARDDNVIYDTRRMFERTTGEAALHIFNSAVHGSSLFLESSPHREFATHLVIDWLTDHLPSAS